MDSAASGQLNVVQTDLPCVGCGYNLRGLRARTECPECGASISRSLDPRDLDCADSNWLRSVLVGHGLLVTCLVMTVYGPVVGMLTAVVLAVMKGNEVGRGTIRAAEQMLTYLGLGAIVAAALGIAIGAWTVAKQEPRNRDFEPVWSVRRGARACLLLLVASITTLAMMTSRWTGGASEVLPLLTALVIGVAATAFSGCMLTLLLRLAQRIRWDVVSRAENLGRAARSRTRLREVNVVKGIAATRWILMMLFSAATLLLSLVILASVFRSPSGPMIGPVTIVGCAMFVVTASLWTTLAIFIGHLLYLQYGISVCCQRSRRRSRVRT